MEINGKLQDSDFISYLEAKIKLETIRGILEDSETEGCEKEIIKLIKAMVKEK